MALFEVARREWVIDQTALPGGIILESVSVLPNLVRKGSDLSIAAGILTSNIDRIVDGWVTELRKKPHTSIHRRLSTRKILANSRALLHALASGLTSERPPAGAEPQRDILREASYLGELRQAQGFKIREPLIRLAKG